MIPPDLDRRALLARAALDALTTAEGALFLVTGHQLRDLSTTLARTTAGGDLAELLIELAHDVDQFRHAAEEARPHLQREGGAP